MLHLLLFLFLSINLKKEQQEELKTNQELNKNYQMFSETTTSETEAFQKAKLYITLITQKKEIINDFYYQKLNNFQDAKNNKLEEENTSFVKQSTAIKNRIKEKQNEILKAQNQNEAKKENIKQQLFLYQQNQENKIKEEKEQFKQQKLAIVGKSLNYLIGRDSFKSDIKEEEKTLKSLQYAKQDLQRQQEFNFFTFNSDKKIRQEENKKTQIRVDYLIQRKQQELQELEENHQQKLEELKKPPLKLQHELSTLEKTPEIVFELKQEINALTQDLQVLELSHQQTINKINQENIELKTKTLLHQETKQVEKETKAKINEVFKIKEELRLADSDVYLYLKNEQDIKELKLTTRYHVNKYLTLKLIPNDILQRTLTFDEIKTYFYLEDFLFEKQIKKQQQKIEAEYNVSLNFVFYSEKIIIHLLKHKHLLFDEQNNLTLFSYFLHLPMFFGYSDEASLVFLQNCLKTVAQATKDENNILAQHFLNQRTQLKKEIIQNQELLVYYEQQLLQEQQEQENNSKRKKSKTKIIIASLKQKINALKEEKKELSKQIKTLLEEVLKKEEMQLLDYIVFLTKDFKNKQISHSALFLQTFFRKHLQQQKYQKTRKQIILIQSFFRQKLAQKEFQKLKEDKKLEKTIQIQLQEFQKTSALEMLTLIQTQQNQTTQQNQEQQQEQKLQEVEEVQQQENQSQSQNNETKTQNNYQYIALAIATVLIIVFVLMKYNNKKPKKQKGKNNEQQTK